MTAHDSAVDHGKKQLPPIFCPWMKSGYDLTTVASFDWSDQCRVVPTLGILVVLNAWVVVLLLVGVDEWVTNKSMEDQAAPSVNQQLKKTSA